MERFWLNKVCMSWREQPEPAEIDAFNDNWKARPYENIWYGSETAISVRVIVSAFLKTTRKCSAAEVSIEALRRKRASWMVSNESTLFTR
jgi:hypothetical protein